MKIKKKILKPELKEQMKAIIKLNKEIRKINKLEYLKDPKKPKRDLSGILKCPFCKGQLYYNVSSVNGHSRGICKTNNCFEWIE